MSLLTVKGLRVRLPASGGQVTVVDGVDYEIEPGQVFGIAGESGIRPAPASFTATTLSLTRRGLPG